MPQAIRRRRVEPTPGTPGGRIRAARLARGWSQMRLATAAGVGHETVRSAETGHLTRITTMIQIAGALDIPLCALGGPPCDTGILHARAIRLEGQARDLVENVERLAAGARPRR